MSKQMTEKQRDYYKYMKTVMEQLEWDLHDTIHQNFRIPPMWREIAERHYRGEKTRITLRVEKDVVRFFKSMGAGYQLRMNDVLSSWMMARISSLETPLLSAPRQCNSHSVILPKAPIIDRFIIDRVLGSITSSPHPNPQHQAVMAS